MKIKLCTRGSSIGNGCMLRSTGAGTGEDTGESQSSPKHRAERWALRTDGGRRTFLMLSAQWDQLQRLGGDAAEGVASYRIPARQYPGDADLLGAVRAEAGAIRLLGGRYDPRPGARTSRSPGSALVRYLEKRQPALYARMDEAGAGALLPVTNKNGERWIRLPRLPKASMDADVHAFTAFMRHLKEADAERTVFMVQVENETGTWGTLRDYSPAAEKIFAAPVPAEVLKAMNVTPGRVGKLAGCLRSGGRGVLPCLGDCALRGTDCRGGQGVYPLPLYVNAALRDPIKPGAPGNYESGGPTDNVIPIWKAEAPAIDVLAPDIYKDTPRRI